MAQATSFAQQNYQSHQQPDTAFVVVDEHPRQREVFPYRLQVKWILGFSIMKCILGSILLITGIANLAIVQYDTKIGIGIWCGLTILSNGIVGCILKCNPNKCLIATFLGLSITSLILSIAMLSLYAIVLDYFVELKSRSCYASVYRTICYGVSSYITVGIGITSFLVTCVVLELVCSIASVFLSCKAYSKFCNTCDVANDCGTCLGCGECDCQPLNGIQENQPVPRPSYNYERFQMSSVQPRGPQPVATQLRADQHYPNQPQFNTNTQASSLHSAGPTRSNPCSGFVSFVINMPSYIFRNSPVSSVNVTIQPIPSNYQGPANQSAPSNYQGPPNQSAPSNYQGPASEPATSNYQGSASEPAPSNYQGSASEPAPSKYQGPTSEPAPSNYPGPASDPVGGADPVQTVAVGGSQQNSPQSTWEKMDA